jgi:putative AlgH/UPF0301 family transcriptional regulator
LAVTAVITGSALADNGPLKIALFQQQLTNGAPQVVADALALEAEQNPTSPHIQYNAGVAAYAAHRWEDALVAFGRWLLVQVFDDDAGAKYDRALRKLGVDPAMLVGDSGHA